MSIRQNIYDKAKLEYQGLYIDTLKEIAVQDKQWRIECLMKKIALQLGFLKLLADEEFYISESLLEELNENDFPLDLLYDLYIDIEHNYFKNIFEQIDFNFGVGD